MRIKEQWKQPVSRADAWKSVLVAVLLVSGIGAFGQIIFNTRFERISWAVLLLLSWTPMVGALLKHGWQVLRSSQGAMVIAYTFFGVGNIIPHGAAASWMVGVGAFAMVGAGILTFVDFRKTKQPVSTDTVPPV